MTSSKSPLVADGKTVRPQMPASEKRRHGGFTLIEAIVSLAILVIVLVISLSMLFTMRSFAQKQELVADARQTARRAVDYLSYYVRGANDMRGSQGGYSGAGPSNSLVMYVNTGGTNGVPVQVSFDNLGTGGIGPAGLADPGTDVITLALAQNARNIPVTFWPGGQHASGNINFNFTDGCPDNIKNMLLFEQMTGCSPPSSCTGSYPSPQANSAILTVSDAFGNWCYVMITSYQGSNCGVSNNQVIQVNANYGGSGGINPPGGEPQLTEPINLGSGVQYYSFRVLSSNAVPPVPQLEQKNGICDPTGVLFGTPDTSPASSFVPILDNVEDLQIAYIFDNGAIYNGGLANQLPAANNYIPKQDYPINDLTDISHVIGLRVTVVARASQPFSIVDVARDKYPLLAAEDHVPVQPPAGDPNWRTFRYRLSATLMLRSRMLGE